MILEIKRNDGRKVVLGGNFSFSVSDDKQLSVFDGDRRAGPFYLKDYPTYNVGGSIVHCEEAQL